MNSHRLRTIASLEERLAPANLTLISAYNCDGYGNYLANPVYGQDVYIRANWNASGMAGTESGIIRWTVNGVSIDSPIVNYTAGSGSYSYYRAGWWIGSTAWSVTVTVDPDNTLAETNENDNTSTFIVTPVAPVGLPSGKFIMPIGHVANQDWGIYNYADVNPATPTLADYGGGTWTYDGHDAIDAGPWSFDKMDAGFPIVAAADGTVAQMADGNFDRENTGPNNPANFVLLSHANDWESLYYHLAANSITVKVGDTVKAGQVIGLMGSSGDSTGVHLHYTTRFHGAQVESGMFPATYWASPLPYAGDVPVFLFDAYYSNYNPGGDTREHVSRTTSFGTGEDGARLLFFVAEIYNQKVTDNVTWKWYQPDGTLALSENYNTAPNYFHTTLKGIAEPLSTFQGIVGTWEVAWEVNGVEYKRLPIVINATGEASVRVTESAKIIIDERTTPLDCGSIASGGVAPTKTYTVNNHGGAPMTLSNLQLPPGFTLSGSFPSSIAAGSSANFVVQMTTTVVGSKFGRVSFLTNDPDTPEYNFNVKGVVTGGIPAGTPALTLLDAALGYNFKSLPRVFAPTATVTDSDSANFSGGNLKVELASGGNAFDALGIRNQGVAAGQIGVSGSNITYGGVSIGTFTGGSTATPLVVTLNAAATPTATQALVRNLTYANTDAVPNYARRYVRLTLTDNTGKVSNLAIAYISPSGVERAPTISTLTPASTGVGLAFTRNGSFADPFANSWTATVNYGDGTGTQALVLNADKSFTLNHSYAVLGNYQVTVTITSDTGGIKIATMTVAVLSPPTVTSVIFGDGTNQRSLVKEIVVAFSEPVNFMGGVATAFTVHRTGTGGTLGDVLLAANPASGPASSVTITFSGAFTEFGSLVDGIYDFMADAAQISGAGGALDGNNDSIPGGSYSVTGTTANRWFRFFGDQNGDAAVDQNDYLVFRNALSGGPNTVFDFDNSGDVDQVDYQAFRNRIAGSP
ncbi:MAG: peptidoglycan DD-metalloendopeptidase family protein [Gemmataceae bacterium]